MASKFKNDLREGEELLRLQELVVLLRDEAILFKLPATCPGCICCHFTPLPEGYRPKVCVASIRNAIASFVFMQDNDDHAGTLGCGKLVPPLATRAWVPRTTRDSSGGDRTYSVHDNQIESLSEVGTWSYSLNTQPIERTYLVPDQGIYRLQGY